MSYSDILCIIYLCNRSQLEHWPLVRSVDTSPLPRGNKADVLRDFCSAGFCFNGARTIECSFNNILSGQCCEPLCHFRTFISVTTTQRNIYNAIFLPEFLIFESTWKDLASLTHTVKWVSLYSAAMEEKAEQKANKSPCKHKFTTLPFKVLGTYL